MKEILAILVTGLLMPIAADAQEWNTYTYQDPGFSIQFPAAPVVQTSTIKNATGVSLPVTRYLVRQDHIVYTLSVVNYSNTNDDALTTILQTQRSLGASGKISAAGGARVNRNFGRALTLDGTDGSHSAIAIFFVDKHLYTVVGQALPPNVSEELDDAVRFQESLQFPEDSGGFGMFFGGSRSKSTYTTPPSPPPSPPPSLPAKPLAIPTLNPAADAACVGKSIGDSVQLETSRGPVAATCRLVARPDSPPDEKP
ncbi:MAG TPA: hypothetical protein VK700_15450 [Steroidobacteraceae bacterium]|nr:hypothetical protein [Steroidobacteraceae bacterium]